MIFGRRVVVGPLSLSNFLFQHPGGESVKSIFAEKDTTAEFDMIHPPDVVEKYAPDAQPAHLVKEEGLHHGRSGEAQQEK